MSNKLKSLLQYDKDTGLFTWLVSPSRNVAKGDTAGYIDTLGYRRIQVAGKLYHAHRLAWFFHYGYWPKQLDHINGNPSDNRIANLRESTQSQNLANARLYANNKSGYKGVHLSKRKGRQSRWVAMIKIKQKQHNLGSYDTAQEAHEAYCKAASLAFGNFARVL